MSVRSVVVQCLGYSFIVLAGAVLLLMFFENALLFHPTKASGEWVPADSQLAVEDVWFTTPNGMVHGWYTCPEPADWYVIFSHGNAGNLSHRQPQLGHLRSKLRAGCLIYDYPGFGQSEGTPDEASCYQAGLAAYDYLCEIKGIPPEKILFLGESLGTGVATYLASSRPHSATVLISPYTSIPDIAQLQFPYLPARWLCRSQFNNLHRLSTYEQPLFLIHGTKDQLVPFQHSEQLMAACPSSRKLLYPMQGAGHNDGVADGVFRSLSEFLQMP